MFTILMHLPKDTDSSPQRMFGGFYREGPPNWSHAQKVPGSQVKMLSYDDAWQTVNDLKEWYAFRQPDYDPAFEVYEIHLCQMDRKPLFSSVFLPFY